MMQRSIFGFLILIFTVYAAESRGVSKEAWIEGFKREFPKMTCADGQFFRTFYKTNKQKCLEKMLEATEFCIAQENLNLPKDFETVDQGRQWGETIGKCAGSRYATLVPMDASGVFKKFGDMNYGKIIGFAIGVAVAFLGLVGLIIWLVVRRRKRS